MEKITFGFNKINGYSLKLVVNEENKTFEWGQCVSSTYVDIWVKHKDLLKLKQHYINNGYKEV